MKNNNTIQVLGSGCPSCKKLFELTQQAVKELGCDTEVEYITDIKKIIEMGVMQSPVLAINGKPVLTGSVPDIETIKQLVTDTPDNTGEGQESSCGCGGSC